MGLQIMSSGGTEHLPWEVRHDVTTGTSVQGTWNNTAGQTNQIDNFFIEQASALVNDEITFKAVLGAGTWTLTAFCCTFTDGGIATVSIDGTAAASLGGSASTFDLYSGGLTYNVKKTITGIVLPALPSAGYRVVSFKAATKNASSSSYKLRMTRLVWTRTT